MFYWKEIKSPGTPKGFENIPPIYEVIKEYEYKDNKETLNVKRAFCIHSDESLRLSYEGREYKEDMTISKGKIISLEMLIIKNLVEFPDINLSEEKLTIALQEFFNQSKAKPKIKTYYNIKRFEILLKELPWQEDLEAVYNGNGIFIIK